MTDREARVRVMTYNVHGCVGTDGQSSVDAVTRLCVESGADLIALQELDAPEGDDLEALHHARDIARAARMSLTFCPTFRRGRGHYGHALLSRFPVRRIAVRPFAGAGDDSEPRGAIWVRATLAPDVELDVISTHLGVRRHERRAQSTELVGERWLDSATLKHPAVVLGDFNAIPDASTYRRIARRLRDAQRVFAGTPRATFPSFWPVLRIDHVFISEGIEVSAAFVIDDAEARRASDHLPLVADLVLVDETARRPHLGAAPRARAAS